MEGVPELCLSICQTPFSRPDLLWLIFLYLKWSKNFMLSRKRSVKRLHFPFNLYQTQSQVMFVYSFNVVIRKLKITYVVDICGLHCITIGQCWSRRHSSCLCPHLLLKVGFFQPSRVPSFRTGLITQLLGSQGRGVAHNLQLNLYEHKPT